MSLNYNEILVLTKASIWSRYRGSYAGFIWVLIAPLMIFSLQGAVFLLIFKVSIDNYLSFLLFGLMPWNFFYQSLEMTVGTLYQNGKVLRSISISPLAMVLSTVFDNLLNNLIVTVLIAVFVLPNHVVLPLKLLLFPLPYLSMVIFTGSWAFYFSFLQVRYYDTKFILNFSLGLLFFISPVLYPESFVPQEFKFILTYNPLSYILAPFREILTPKYDLDIFFYKTLLSYAVSVFSLIFVLISWRINKKQTYLRFN